MPKTIRLRLIVPRTPTSQAQALLYTAVRKRMNDWDWALKKWYRIDRVKPEEGELLGWSTSKVKKHSAILSNTVPRALEIAKAHQEGRGTDEVPTVRL